MSDTTMFLHFLACKLLGPPVNNLDGGTWPCPKCGHVKFHVKPHEPGKKDRYKCWLCDWDSKPCDVFDLLWDFHPDSDYGWRKTRIAELQAEYAGSGNSDVALSFPSGEGGGHGDNGIPPTPKTDRRTLDAVLAGFTALDYDLLAMYHELAERKGVSLADLGKRCADFRAWVNEIEQQHLAECTDGECDAIVCRKKRGLPPLTPEGIEAGRRARGLPPREVKRYKPDKAFIARIRSLSDAGDRHQTALLVVVPWLLERCPGLVTWWKQGKGTSLVRSLIEAAEIVASCGGDLGMSLDCAADELEEHGRQNRERAIAERLKTLCA